jgi:glycosyltransferase involved in cell wall biosynthesis
MKSNMKVAIVHDWFVGGGAEMVVLEIHKMFPDAPIYTSYCSPAWREKLPSAKIVTSYMQKWPFPMLRKFLPVLRQRWFEGLDLSQFDLVISSSGAEAKGIKVPPGVIHINYCHAPTHYYWARYDEYIQNPGFGFLDPLARIGLKLFLKPMRSWDKKAAGRPDHIIANSNFTASQVKKYYGRESTVIYPPVDVTSFAPSKKTTRHGFVITGRHTHYKRFDLAVAACTKLSLPLTVVGDGPEKHKLTKLAGPTITFAGFLDRKEVIKKVQSAEGFIFPGTDDFGISAVEALAAGTPVIAYKSGGALDYITDGKTGIFFNEQSVDSVSSTLKKFLSKKFDNKVVANSVGMYGEASFRKKFEQYVNNVIGD